MLWLAGLDRFQQTSNSLFQRRPPVTLVRSACSNNRLDLAAMDGGNIESVSGEPLPGATIPLDSNGAHSGDSEVKKRARSNSPNGEVAEGPTKRVKGVAPIKAE